MSATPFKRTIIGIPNPAPGASGSGQAVGFTSGPNVATAVPGQPYTAGSTLIAFDHQVLERNMAWWVLPAYTGYASVALNFAPKDGDDSGGTLGFQVGIDDVGDLQQTFAKTADVSNFFNDGQRPAGPTFFLRNAVPDGFNIVQPGYFEPSPGHVREPRLFIPGRRVALWVYGSRIGPQPNTIRLDVTGAIYAIGATS